MKKFAEIVEKVEGSEVKDEIEFKKVREIVENLEKEPEEDTNEIIKRFLDPLNLNYFETNEPFKIPLSIFETTKISQKLNHCKKNMECKVLAEDISERGGWGLCFHLINFF